ncbi:hypothetical protein W413_02618, partial [Staphylococcus aureus VET0080R]
NNCKSRLNFGSVNLDFGSEKTMRTEKEILNLVSEFAYQRSNVKIIALEGSRTNENIKKISFKIMILLFSYQILSISHMKKVG